MNKSQREQVEKEIQSIAGQVSTWMVPAGTLVKTHVRTAFGTIHVWAEVPKPCRGMLIGKAGATCEAIRKIIRSIGKVKAEIEVMYHVMDDTDTPENFNANQDNS